MNPPSRQSKRFTPNSWTQRVVPVLLLVLSLGLVLLIIFIVLAALGVV